MRRVLPCLVLTVALLAGGCDDYASDGQPEVAGPVVVRSEPQPPPLPPLAHIAVAQQMYEFPRARLRVQQKDDQIQALLFSDDPARREDDAQAGNSFYFEMRLEIDELDQLDQAHWAYRAASADRAESPNGIFLDGWRKHLQPMDVEVLFGPHPELPDRLVAHLVGEFILFHTRDRNQAPVWVAVDARLIVSPETAK